MAGPSPVGFTGAIFLGQGVLGRLGVSWWVCRTATITSPGGVIPCEPSGAGLEGAVWGWGSGGSAEDGLLH